MRDETVRDKEIVCPDCQGDILIVDRQGKLIGIPHRRGAQLPDFSVPRTQPPGSKIIAGMVAALLLLGLALFAFMGNPPAGDKPVAAPEEPSDQQHAAPPASAPASSAPIALSGERNAEQKAMTPPPAAQQAAKKEPQVEQLETMGKWIGASVGENHAFPAQTTGWSWLADIAERHLGPKVARRKDLNWDAPANDDFVRRSFKELLNPALPSAAGEDHYPATHYVGITGATFPKTADAPAEFRPGIFGSPKPVKAEDIQGGLSNTLLMAGAITQHGSWARPGTATGRGFTAEPFLSGPDGFGTGQSDGQYVLMADGSTRFLSAKADSNVVRQMASLQGVPPSSIAATPKEGVPVPPAPALSMETKNSAPPASTDDVPVSVPVVPEPPKIDLKKRLAQRIVRFEQPQPATLADVMFDVQELLGFPIDLSSLPEELRQKKVKLKLEQTTAGDILKAIAEEASVGYSVHPDRIQIHLKN